MVASPEAGSPADVVVGIWEVVGEAVDAEVVEGEAEVTDETVVGEAVGTGVDIGEVDGVGAGVAEIVVGAAVAVGVVATETPTPHHVFAAHASQYDCVTSWHAPSPKMHPAQGPQEEGAVGWAAVVDGDGDGGVAPAMVVVVGAAVGGDDGAGVRPPSPELHSHCATSALHGHHVWPFAHGAHTLSPTRVPGRGTKTKGAEAGSLSEPSLGPKGPKNARTLGREGRNA